MTDESQQTNRIASQCQKPGESSMLRRAEDVVSNSPVMRLNECQQEHQEIFQQATTNKGDHQRQHQLAESYLKIGKLLADQEDVIGADEAYQHAFPIYHQLANEEKHQADWQQGLANTWMHIGHLLRDHSGNLEEARDAFLNAEQIIERLLSVEKESISHQKELITIYAFVGDISFAMGEPQQAILSYRQAQIFAEAHLLADPEEVFHLQHAVVIQDKISLALQEAGETEAALEQMRSLFSLQEQLKINGTEKSEAELLQAELTLHQRMGDLLMQNDDLLAAQDEYELALQQSIQLTVEDWRDAKRQRTLAVSYRKLGDVLLRMEEVEESLVAYQKSLGIRERQVMKDPSILVSQHELAEMADCVGDVLRIYKGDVSKALECYQQVLAIHLQLSENNSEDPLWKRRCFVSYDKIGDALRTQGNLAEALSAYESSLQATESIASADWTESGCQRDVAVNYDKVGNIYSAQGKHLEALEFFQKSRFIREQLVVSQPGHAACQRDLAVSYDKLGDLYLTYYDDLASAASHYEKLSEISRQLAEVFPENVECQRDLSVAHDKLGDVLRAQGNLPEALKSYRASLTIREELLSHHIENSVWQRSLAISHEKIGDVLRMQGVHAKALESYVQSHKIRQKLASNDPHNTEAKRDLANIFNSIGDLHRVRNNLQPALVAYRESLKIRQQLAEHDPDNTAWQRDLSIGHDRVGDISFQLGNLDEALAAFLPSLKIREGLSKQETENYDWQRDLAVSRDKIGFVLMHRGEMDGSLKAYHASQEVIANLAKKNPKNAERQRDLAICHNNLGEIYLMADRAEEAIKEFRASYTIRRKLVEKDKTNTEWMRALALICDRVGEFLHRQQQQHQEALSFYQESQELLMKLAAQDWNSPSRQNDIAVSHRRIGDVYLGLSDLSSALEAYQKSFTIRERLVDNHPDTIAWKRDKAVILNKIGDVCLTENRPQAALDTYLQSHAIIHELVEAYPADAALQRDQAASYHKQAMFYEQTGDRQKVNQYLVRCYKTLLAMEQSNISLDEPMADLLKHLKHRSEIYRQHKQKK